MYPVVNVQVGSTDRGRRHLYDRVARSVPSRQTAPMSLQTASGTSSRIDSRTCTPRSPPRALVVLSGGVKPSARTGQCPVIPRYSRGTDETAGSAPAADRRDAPTSSNSGPLPPASQLAAPRKEIGSSNRRSASIQALFASTLRATRHAWPMPQHGKEANLGKPPRFFGVTAVHSRRCTPRGGCYTRSSSQIEQSAEIGDGHSRIKVSGREHRMSSRRHAEM